MRIDREDKHVRHVNSVLFYHVVKVINIFQNWDAWDEHRSYCQPSEDWHRAWRYFSIQYSSHSVIRIPRASRKFWANLSPLFHNRWLGHCPITGGKIRDNPYFETGGAYKVWRARQSEDVISRVLQHSFSLIWLLVWNDSDKSPIIIIIIIIIIIMYC